MTTRVAIIGAGPCGLSQLQAFATARDRGLDIPEVVCFDKQEDWGGLWNFTWRTGTDEYGELVHTSMYRYLWSNGPKECLEFADYTFEEHFGKPIPSFPPREVLRDYLEGRAKKSDVRKYIRFRTAVRMVEYSNDTGRFTVTSHDLKNNNVVSEEFDYVVVASGHFSVPNVPYFEGVEGFPGRVLHAHDFRDALEFKGKDILVVGASYSAEDIGLQCYKYGAKSVTSCYRSGPMDFHWPDAWEERPLFTRIDGSTVHFDDGSSKVVDAIILCTGYLHHFPFLTDDLRLETGNRLWPLGLYKGVVWEDNPKLMYLGMQDQFYTFNMFDVQAWYARDVIMGRVQLPSRETMRQDSQAWRAREEKLAGDEQLIRFQGDNIRDLLAETDYPDFDVHGMDDTFVTWEHHKHEDIMGYRNHSHKSLITGTEQPKHHTDWMDAMDDSMKAYLGAN